MLADHPAWTVHRVGILVHLVAGRGETTTHGRGVGFLSLSRDHKHHLQVGEMQVLRRSHVMLCIGSAKLCHSGCQAKLILFLFAQHEPPRIPGHLRIKRFNTFRGSRHPILPHQKDERSAHY
jgi:hypothetical protein